MLYVYLAVGGMAGTLARYGLGVWVHSWAGTHFPWGTLTVNLLGSFLLGLAIRGAEFSTISPELRIMVTVGFCGAFTTFSTLGFETLALMQTGAWGRALLYAVGSFTIGVAAVALGFSAGAVLGPSGG